LNVEINARQSALRDIHSGSPDSGFSATHCQILAAVGEKPAGRQSDRI
jgi:hypothetical protein